MVLKKQRREFPPVNIVSAHSDQRPPRMASSTIEHFSQECMRLSMSPERPLWSVWLMHHPHTRN